MMKERPVGSSRRAHHNNYPREGAGTEGWSNHKKRRICYGLLAAAIATVGISSIVYGVTKEREYIFGIGLRRLRTHLFQQQANCPVPFHFTIVDMCISHKNFLLTRLDIGMGKVRFFSDSFVGAIVGDGRNGISIRLAFEWTSPALTEFVDILFLELHV